MLRRSRLFGSVLVQVLALVVGLSAQDLPPGGGFLGAPLSSKIWDDPSLNNLAGKGHKALGYATVTLATSAWVVQNTVANSPDTVTLLSNASAVSAGTTVLAGLVSHWEKLSFSGDMLTWNNLHALTAVLGASIIIASQWAPDAVSRQNWGLGGAGLLTLAIIFEG